MKKRRRVENFEIQVLREIVKENAPDAVEKFENKFKEFRIEGKRKALSAFETNCTEKLPKTYYTKEENKEIEAMYMGTESKARRDIRKIDLTVDKVLSLWMEDSGHSRETDMI